MHYSLTDREALRALPIFARADAIRELLDDELAAALARAASDPVAVARAELLAASRAARLVVPDLFAVDPVGATGLVHAMACGTDDDFAYLLHQACTSGLTVWAADTALERPVIDVADAGEYLAPAADTNTSAAGDGPRVKRGNGTVRGHVRRSVVGDASGIYGAHDVRDVAAMTAAWCALHGVDLEPMIGTDDYAWQEVHHTALLVTGDDMGDSLVGRGDRRVRLADKGTKAAYIAHTASGRRVAPSHKPASLWAQLGAEEWAEATLVTTITYPSKMGRTRFIGHGRADHLAPTRDRKAATPRPPTVTLDAATAAERIADDIAAMHGSGVTTSRRYSLDGVGLLTLRHDHTRRTYRVTLTTTVDGRRVSRKLTDTRSTHTALAAIERATVPA